MNRYPHMRLITIILSLLISLPSFARSEKGDYLNPKLSTEKRVADLLGRMTIEEKVGQLLCPLGWVMYDIKSPDRVEVADTFKRLIDDRQAGMLWAVYRADPWTQKTLDNGLNPRLAAMAGNAIQKYVIENTRLGIPMFIAEEAPHGHMAIGTTVFPTGIGMAATWNPELMERVGQVIGAEVRNQGAHISYGPVLDLARDPRWSRVEETMGEDPTLGGIMGAGIIKGLGAGNLAKPHSTIATLKHFLAYAVPEGGQNGNYSTVGQRDLLQYFLPPFKKAVDAGALSIMTSYNSIDGVPCSSNKSLLTDLLIEDWKFRGFTVSDLYSIDGLYETHHITPTIEDAALLALNAGLDVDLGGDAYMALLSAAKSGKLDSTALDRAVGNVLRMKFEMGLFENPYVDPDKAAKTVGTKANGEIALDVARQSITLLENKNGLLPLDPKKVKVAVIGPNADNAYNQLGDYTAPQPDGRIVTVLDGVRKIVGSDRVEYVKGCAIRDKSKSDIDAAIKAARRADVVIAVVGGSSARDFKTSYQKTAAAEVDKTSLSDMESGEGYDRTSLTLLGDQNTLLESLKATGKPLVVVYIEGRPLEKGWSAENADALLTAYYPGQEGGQAIADVIFGAYNPAGRLPFTVPRSAGQIPLYYNKRLPKLHDYVDMSATPQYPFGYGLSYTEFSYSNMKVKNNATTGLPETVTCEIENVGDRDGEEVAQLYLRDCVATTVQPMIQLKEFKRIALKKGEKATVTFNLTPKDFEIIGIDYKPVIEPGAFDLMIGSSSANIKLTQTVSYTR